MKGHKLMKGHPLQKGAGMPYFEKEHWQKDVKDIECVDERYASEMNTCEEYHEMANGLASYARKHKAKH